MSDAAKKRVIALGTQFNTAEHSTSEPLGDGAKKPFWKRNTSKFPGR